MPESYRYTPKSFDSIDSAAPAKVEAVETTIPTHENGNRITPESSFKNKLVMEQAQSLLKSGIEKVTAFGSKTGELFSSAAEKTGGFFGSLKGSYEKGFKEAYERNQTEGKGVEEMKSAVSATVAESTSEVTEATSEVEGLGHNFTLEKVAGSREALKGAAEKSAVAGAENSSLLKIATERIGKYLKKTLRELLVEVLGEMRTPESQKKAEHAKEQMGVLSLLDDIRGIASSEKPAEEIEAKTSAEEVGEVSESEGEVNEEEIEEDVPSAAEEQREIPVLRDEGIEHAFAQAAEARAAKEAQTAAMEMPKAANDNEILEGMPSVANDA